MSLRKKLSSILVPLLFLLPFSSALLQVANAETTSSAKVRVGVVLPLTGALAEYGVAAKNGVLLAQKEYFNELANVEFIFEDSRYDTAATVTACKKLQSIDHAAIQYVWGYGPAAACAAIADSIQAPTLAISSDPKTEIGRSYVVRFATNIERHSETLVRYLKNSGFKRIAIVASEIPFFTGVIEGIQRRIGTDQTLVLVERVQPDEMELKTTLLRVKKSNPDVVGVLLLSAQIGQYYKAASVLAVNSPTFGSDFFDSESEIAAAPIGIRGAVFPAPDVTEQFKERYRIAYNSTAQLPYAANAYDFATLLAQVIPTLSDPLAPKAILDAFRKISTTQGASGTFKYEEKREFSPGFDFNVVLKQVGPDGKLHIIEGTRS